MVKAKLFVTYDEMVCTMMGRKKENGTNPWIQKKKRRQREKKEGEEYSVKKSTMLDHRRSKRYRYLHLRPTTYLYRQRFH